MSRLQPRFPKPYRLSSQLQRAIRQPTYSCSSDLLIDIYRTPPGPTLPGTASNCGNYYLVQSGDSCDTISLNYSISYALLVNLNPSINSGCTNLLSGYDYCVAPVNGTIPLNVTTTPTQTATSPPSTTSFARAPTQTVNGTTPDCYNWYTVKSGDTCSAIVTSYGITLAQFRSWNTYINAGCTNFFLNYAYCVSSPDPITIS